MKIWAIFCLLSLPAWADLATGEEALLQGDYQTALQELSPLAEAGNASAQYHLAYMYAEGEGVPQDYGEAAKWFRSAADQGMVAAQSSLGGLYERGEGVPQDNQEAIRWYRSAADQGDRLPPATAVQSAVCRCRTSR